MKTFSKDRLDYIYILRLCFCFGVLLFHLGVLKGGFYAVCGFFVISGYLLCRSLDKDDLDLLKHYKKRFVKLYIPLIATVFSVILACNIIDFFWVTMKPEITSVICGYDNYYQISVNSDYFARAGETPFIHLWYISILLQFELVFPLLFVFFRWIGKKIKGFDTQVLTLFFLIVSIIYFYVSFTEKDISSAYYGSLERIYCLLFGVFVYFLKKGNDQEDTKTVKRIKKAMFFLILALMIAGMFFIGSDTGYMAEYMLLFTLLTAVEMILADDIGRTDSILFVPVRLAASVTYEVYLIHYPLMVIWNSLFFGRFTADLNILYMILATAAVSVLLHALFSVRSRWANPILVLLCVVLGFTTAYGGVLYALEKDHTEEMNELKAQLAMEEEDLQLYQEDYLKKLNEENMKWEELLSSYEDENYAEKAASAVRVCGIGDSVLLGASPYIYNVIGNFYCDAVVSRPGLYVRDIMAGMKNSGILQEAVLVHIGSNGGLWAPQMNDIVNYVNSNGLQLFWVTVTNDRSKDIHCNAGIRDMCARYDNVHLIDWEVLSAGHSNWFVGDGIHVNGIGGPMYASFVYNEIHGYYVAKYEAERQKVLAEYEEAENRKYSFYGGDMLTALHSGLADIYEESSFKLIADGGQKSLIDSLKEDIDKKTIARNVAVFLDNSLNIDAEGFREMKALLEEKRLVIVSMNGDPELAEEENIAFIPLDKAFGDDYRKHLHADRLHLNDLGIEETLKLVEEAFR